MTDKPFYLRPILNSPYYPPCEHHVFNADGTPTALDPEPGRRRSTYITPVPASRKKSVKDQSSFAYGDRGEDGQEYGPSRIINELRGYLDSWRRLPESADWGVTATTKRLLQHWRHHGFEGPRPFFCQLEAVETAIWLAEVADRRRQHRAIFGALERANALSNPELFRLSMKLATGAGKTTVMAMLIAWQTANAVRMPNSKRFTKGFLIVAPGITIKERLRVLLPSDPNSYFKTREILPPDMLPDIQKAKVVITNYHAFQLRSKMSINKTSEGALSGWREEKIQKIETEGEMLRRAVGDLLHVKNPIVINDEAHHCYREKPGATDEDDLKGDDRREAQQNNEEARLWINGLEALKRRNGLTNVYDLSATPFFLRGSGYSEGTLFPWVVSDFNLVDAIESGIVKLPRVPVADNAIEGGMPVLRDLWSHIGKQLPKKGAGKAGDIDPSQIPNLLQSALKALYDHYAKEYELWEQASIGVPPVFIVVCNNTATSRLVYEWISGHTRLDEDGEERTVGKGNLELFRNFDEHGNRLPRMRTLLIDSHEIEAGGDLDPAFRKAAANEIDAFKRERQDRDGAGGAGEVTEAELLREVMNTVGQKGRLGERIRCVVSVSMLTEGWDANTVTHILGVRAFGTQLLCEQVVGRGLRRLSYQLTEETDRNGHRIFGPEYADILGIPFDFASEPMVQKPAKPKPITQVMALKERAALSIRFPRVAGYRSVLPADSFAARFTGDSTLTITPKLVGPSRTQMAGLAGEDHELVAGFDQTRESTIAAELTKKLIELRYREGSQEPPFYLFGKLLPIVRRWVAEHLKTEGDTHKAMASAYPDLAEKACTLIYAAIVRGADGGAPQIRAMLDPYNEAGVTDHVRFPTTKTELWTTAPDKSQVNYVVCDSEWEAEFARVVERHPKTLAYVKNQGLGFDIPYLRGQGGTEKRRYIPDFIVQMDDGGGPDDPLNVVVEIKGFRDLDVQVKSETARSLWVPGVNALGTFGRWAFVELMEPYKMSDEWTDLAETAWAKKVDGLAVEIARKDAAE